METQRKRSQRCTSGYWEMFQVFLAFCRIRPQRISGAFHSSFAVTLIFLLYMNEFLLACCFGIFTVSDVCWREIAFASLALKRNHASNQTFLGGLGVVITLGDIFCIRITILKGSFLHYICRLGREECLWAYAECFPSQCWITISIPPIQDDPFISYVAMLLASSCFNPWISLSLQLRLNNIVLVTVTLCSSRYIKN